MAITNEKTDLFTNLSASPPLLNARPGMLQVYDFLHTQGAAAGDANSTIELYRVQPGMAVDLFLSMIKFSAYGAARVLSLGYRAYTDAAGNAIVANLTGLFSALDVAAPGLKHFIEAPTLGAGQINGLRTFGGTADLVLQVTGGTIPIGAVTQGRLVIRPAGS